MLPTVTITGTVVTPGGTPLTDKRITFTLEAPITDAANDILVAARRWTATLDANGALTDGFDEPFVLVPSDADGLAPTPVGYTVQEQWRGGQTFRALIPSGVSSVAYTELSPVGLAPTPPTAYVQLPDFLAEVDDRVAGDAETLASAAVDATAKVAAQHEADDDLYVTRPLTDPVEGEILGWDPDADRAVGVDLSSLYDAVASLQGIEAVKTVDQVRSGRNGTWNDSELAFRVEDAGDYEVVIDPLFVSGDQSGDFECGFNSTAPGFAYRMWIDGPPSSAVPTSTPGTPTSAEVNTYGKAPNAWTNTDTYQNPGGRAGRSPRIGMQGTGVPGSDPVQKLRVHAVITVTGPGNIFFAWSQYQGAASGSEGARVYAKSRLRAKAVSNSTTILNGAQWTSTGGNVYTAQTPQKPWNLRFTKDAVRLELRAGDQWIGDSSKGKGTQRVQMAGPRWPLDTPLWSSFAFRLNGLDAGSQMTLLYQLKQAPEISKGEYGKLPSAALKFVNGNMHLKTAGDPNPVTTKDTYRLYEAIPWQTPWYGVHATDGTEWTYIVMRTVLHWEHGEIDLYVNGTEVFSGTGLICGYNDTANGAKPISALDIYRGSQAITQVVEFANVEVGTTSLLDRVTAPLALPALPW